MLQYNLEVSNTTVTNDVDNTVTIAVKLAEPVFACGVGYEVSCSSGIELIGVTAIEDSSFAGFTFTNGTLYWENYVDDVPVDVELSDLGLITVKIPAGTDEGRYNVTLSGIELADASWNYPAESDTVTATIEVKEPEAPKTGFHIYYELDKAESEGPADQYVEYGVGDIVTADVYLVNYDKADVLLQAYDIYLTYDSNLSYAGLSGFDGTAYNADGDEAAAADVVSHIQLVAEENVKINFPKEQKVLLGSIKFKVANTAVFGENMPIALVIGENSQTVTNIAVGKADKVEGGDKESYYPVDVSEVEGVEVNTTYTVTYDANEGAFEVGAVTSQEKQHNIDLTLEPGTPTRDGYSFLGWSEDDEATEPTYTTEEGKNVYTTNAATTLYAVWQQNTKTITFNANDGSDTPATETQTVNHGVATVLDANIFNRTGYTFAGWNTEANGSGATYADKASITITEDTTLYAQWTINKYTVTWYNYDGTQLHRDENVEYGATPVYDGQTPTKPDSVDGQFAYTHDGWSATQGGAKLDPLPAVDGNEEFYALFAETTKSYNVTFDAGEGSFAADADTEVTVEYGQMPNAQDIPAPTAPDGYEFTGWSDGTKTYSKDLSDFTVTGEVELTAQYAAAEYVITLDPNGGAVSDMTADEDGKYTITYTITSKDKLPAATKTGYAFDGWKLVTKTDGWEANTYGANTPVTGMWGDVELVAQWSEDKHTVMQSDSVQNGTATPDKQSAKEGDTITVTVKPDEGYKFGENDKVTYTYTDAEGTTHNIQITVSDDDGDGVFTGTFPMVDYNVEINATFTAIDYTVNANANPSGFATVTPDKTTANINDEITLTISDVKDGYQLKNYTVTNDSTDETITVTNGKFTMPAANVTVTANLEGKSYQIIYDANGGENTMNPGNGTFGTETTLVTNSFAKTGYTFEGWTTTEGGTTVEYTDEAGFNPETYAEGYTLYAVWKANQYDVTLNYGYADQEDGSIIVTYDATYYPTLIDPERTGYTFAGWYDGEAEGANKITATTVVNTAGVHTLYATWTPNKHTVTLNYGSTSDTVEVEYDQIYTVPSASANGYDFLYWENEFGEIVNSGSAVTITGDIELTAKWSLVNYTITFRMEDNKLIREMEYDIEDTEILGDATNGLYTFLYWELAEDTNGWKAGTYNADTAVTGKWGNVTLIAQWTRAAVVAVEEYQYAANGDWLIRVDATDLDSSKEYQFNGESMYYTTDENYLIDTNDTGVFYYLISGEYVEKDDQTGLNKLKDAGYELLSIETTSGRLNLYAEGDVNGDINGDKVLNIADANIIYQMVINGGSYYGDTLDMEARLKADMNTDLENQVKRGSTKDVDVIVNMINGKTN